MPSLTFFTQAPPGDHPRPEKRQGGLPREERSILALPARRQAAGVRAAWSQPFNFPPTRPRCSGDAGTHGRPGVHASQKAGDERIKILSRSRDRGRIRDRVRDRFRARARFRARWPLPRPLPRSRILSAPAFWSAYGGPASHHRRGRAGVTGRAATTPMARRRPTPAPEEMLSSPSPGEPGSAIVREAPRCRMVDPAQWRAQHPDVAPFPRAQSGIGPGSGRCRCPGRGRGTIPAEAL